MNTSVPYAAPTLFMHSVETDQCWNIQSTASNNREARTREIHCWIICPGMARMIALYAGGHDPTAPPQRYQISEFNLLSPQSVSSIHYIAEASDV